MLLVLPADHHIKNISGFHGALRTGKHFARQGYLITFGIVPLAPETGYGYVRKGNKITASGENVSRGELEAVTIDQFEEKPDLETAEEYVIPRKVANCVFFGER